MTASVSPQDPGLTDTQIATQIPRSSQRWSEDVASSTAIRSLIIQVIPAPSVNPARSSNEIIGTEVPLQPRCHVVPLIMRVAEAHRPLKYPPQRSTREGRLLSRLVGACRFAAEVEKADVEMGRYLTNLSQSI